MLLGNWRFGLIAFFGGSIGAAVALYKGVDLANLNLGPYGFNSALAAVVVFLYCDGKLRLATLWQSLRE
ncbi:MAG: hypothetical protein COB93_02830 [Sneathiella sp.]|nr:MAG: hypothetical protein COB93_02830 [Sneathiella sp.]